VNQSTRTRHCLLQLCCALRARALALSRSARISTWLLLQARAPSSLERRTPSRRSTLKQVPIARSEGKLSSHSRWKYPIKLLVSQVALRFTFGVSTPQRSSPTGSLPARLRRVLAKQLRPNHSLKRTHHGMPRLGLISFWPNRVTPRCAA
jgi:hypothetical protein